MATSTQAPKYLNTYRLEPKKKFSCNLVKLILEDVVKQNCHKEKYDSSKSAEKVQIIAEEVLQRVKKLNFDRYRFVVFVQIGANKLQELNTVVTFLWDSSKDSFATYSLKSGSMFTTATCFGIYKD